MTMPTISSPIHRHAPRARASRLARAPDGRGSPSRRSAGIPLVLVWALTPAMLGLVAASLQVAKPGWALLIFVSHQALAWTLTFRHDLPIASARGDWLTVAAVAALTVALCLPVALLWLLLPVLPATFLHSACCHGRPTSVRKLMRIFFLAAFAAVLTHLAGIGPAAGVIIAVTGASLLWFIALEKIVVPLITGHNDPQTEHSEW